MKNKEHKIELKRPGNRWLMLFYDTLIYFFCWLIVLLAFQMADSPFALFMAVGYFLFGGLRICFGVYRIVLRYGTISAFTRLMIADIIAGSLLLLTNFGIRVYSKGDDMSFLILVCIIAGIILVSITARLAYCNLYRFAKGKSRVSAFIRLMLEHLALVDFKSDVSGATLHLVLASNDTVPVYINELQWIVDKFAIRGQVTSITQLNSGYINRTYRVETVSENDHVHKYTLQRINNNVFRDVDLLMENYKLVTDTLYGKLKLGEFSGTGSVQTLRPTKDGRSYLSDESGYWRMMTYFDNVYSMDIPSSPEVFGRAGYAFGSFLKALEDMDINAIGESIPNFHNTMSRYEALEESIKNHPDGRTKDVEKEIAFVRARANKYGMITDALESGEIPKRICHNDCNLNNILFDKKTHKPVAIIDLDTVMPSSPLYDFGDSMRIGTNTAKDDEKDLSKVSCNLTMYEHYARGYLEACGDILTKRELELLPYSAMIITVEDGIRFLMDHIDGDIYYTISYPGQNLDRARTQLKLVEDMERKLPEIKKILRNIYRDLGLFANI